MKLKMGVVKVAHRSMLSNGESLIVPVHDPELTISEKEYERLGDVVLENEHSSAIGILDSVLHELGIVIGDWDAKKSTHREALQ